MSAIATLANMLWKWNRNGFIFFTTSLLCLLSRYSSWFQMLTVSSAESYFRKHNPSVAWCIEWHFLLPKACSRSKTEQEEGERESIPTRPKCCYLLLPNTWHLAATSKHFLYDATSIFFLKQNDTSSKFYLTCVFNTLECCANSKPQGNAFSITFICVCVYIYMHTYIIS